VPLGDGRCELQQISRFLPRGLFGILYWHFLSPFHHYIYKGMLEKIARTLDSPASSRPERFSPMSPSACEITPGALEKNR
jgi:hypothetical protein